MSRNELAALAAPQPPFRHLMVGGGHPAFAEGVLRLGYERATRTAYANAQVDDYSGGRSPFRHRPPLRLRLRARMSHAASHLQGTAGFGFWNYPLALPPRLPRAIWFFFGSPPGDLPLAMGVPGHGWKAAVIDATRPRALALLPLAPLAVPLFNLPALHRGLYPLVQRAVGVAEAPVRAPLDAWHEYQIEWGVKRSRLLVDGRVVLDEAPSPRGPLCFVAWIDNQFLVLTPQGRARWGLLDVAERQWIELANLAIEPL